MQARKLFVTTVTCLVILFASPIFFSCSFFTWLPVPPATDQFIEHPGSGSRLLRHGSYIYLAEGSVDSAPTALHMVAIDGDGNLGTWKDTASLPEDIKDGAFLAAGSLVYMIGGRTESSFSDKVYYTMINSDGTLGFGANHSWESNLRDLPEGRAYAASVLHDGWIYLIGGKTSSGATNSIIRARIYQDGQVGQWYASDQVLPAAVWGSSACVMGDRLYVAGGADASGTKKDVTSFALGTYGALSGRRIELALPQPKQEAILLADNDTLLLAGGFDDTKGSRVAYRYAGGSWSILQDTIEAEGPAFARIAGNLLYLFQINPGTQFTVYSASLALAPEAPVVVPGSGMVPSSSPIIASCGPGLSMHYRTDGGIPTFSDPVYPATPLKVAAAVTATTTPRISLAAFNAAGDSSLVEYRDYQIRSGSLFVTICGSLAVHEAGYSELEAHTLQDSGNPPTIMSSIWYKMTISTAGKYRLSWADFDDDPLAYTAKLLVSLYEVDLYTEVPDSNEIAVHDRIGGLVAPLHLNLQPGEYYVYIRDRDLLQGRTFGMSLCRE